jgi:signal transduction histidine kinase
MSTTITTLLAIARGEETQTSTRTSIGDVISATVASTRTGERSIVIDAGGQGTEDLRVNATTESAARALSPLVENAVQHAVDQVTVSVRGSGRTVAITISDDGPGLPTDGRDPEFFFAAGARTPDSTGAGLGLALARRVARTLGGDVTVTSVREPTSFTLTLPRP